jgi:hypothetical protein
MLTALVKRRKNIKKHCFNLSISTSLRVSGVSEIPMVFGIKSLELQRMNRAPHYFLSVKKPRT